MEVVIIHHEDKIGLLIAHLELRLLGVLDSLNVSFCSRFQSVDRRYHLRRNALKTMAALDAAMRNKGDRAKLLKEAEDAYWVMNHRAKEKFGEKSDDELLTLYSKLDTLVMIINKLDLYGNQEQSMGANHPFIKIWGIGPKYADLLISNNIVNLDDLATADPERLRRILDMQGWERVEKWIDQAKRLMEPAVPELPFVFELVDEFQSQLQSQSPSLPLLETYAQPQQSTWTVPMMAEEPFMGHAAEWMHGRAWLEAVAELPQPRDYSHEPLDELLPIGTSLSAAVAALG